MGKVVSSKVQVPPLLRHRHNATLGLLNKTPSGHRSDLSLRPLLHGTRDCCDCSQFDQ